MSEYDLIRELCDLSPAIERLVEEEEETYSRGFTATAVFPVLFGYLHELRENLAESAVADEDLMVIMQTLEAHFRDGDADERAVLVVSFLERILGSDRVFRPMLGPSLTAELERMEAQRPSAT